jgi:DNA polymerase-3 subunit epsilon
MNEFIAIDFETAVFSPNSAVSIGLVKYRAFKPVDSFYSLIRPPRLYIRPDFTDIHGLTVDDVRDAPNFKHIWENDAIGFIGKTPLAAHNATFDMGVLRATLEHYEIPMPKIKYFCSLALSRKTWPAMRSHALASLAKEKKIIYKAHNALADAETCGKIIGLCACDLGEDEEAENFTLAQFLHKAGIKMRHL